MRLVVNDTERIPENLPECWGELLERLEQEAASRGELVSAVRFDAVEEPSFQTADCARRRLTGIGTIEIESVTPQALLDAALLEGERAARALAQAALEASSAFRSNGVAAANGHLAELGDGVRSLMMMLDTLTKARGTTLDAVDCGGRSLRALLVDLARQVELTIEAQQSQDWLTVADLLEYELEPALRTFCDLFETLRSK